MSLTLILKWANAEEIAEWAYFVTVVNKSMTAQDILIDNGEAAKAEFVWWDNPEKFLEEGIAPSFFITLYQALGTYGLKVMFV